MLQSTRDYGTSRFPIQESQMLRPYGHMILSETSEKSDSLMLSALLQVRVSRYLRSR